jgi:hypothetical protein
VTRLTTVRLDDFGFGTLAYWRVKWWELVEMLQSCGRQQGSALFCCRAQRQSASRDNSLKAYAAFNTQTCSFP